MSDTQPEGFHLTWTEEGIVVRTQYDGKVFENLCSYSEVVIDSRAGVVSVVPHPNARETADIIELRRLLSAAAGLGDAPTEFDAD
jgi:hypothetical protein